MTKWKKIESKKIYQNPLFTTEMHLVELPNGKQISDYLYLNAKDGANIVAITEKEELILIEQYKYAINKTILTTPGGLADSKKENLLHTAKRELLEETGYVAKKITKIGEFYPLPGNVTQKTFVFLATGCYKKSSKLSLDETEFIKVKLIPLSKLNKLIKENKLNDSMSLAALTFYINNINKNPYVK